MPKNNFSPQELQVEEWFKKARDDGLNVRSILTHRDGTPTAVCFLCQQMAEKYLKAFLVLRKNWFPRIHPLDKLVEISKGIEPSFVEIKDDAILLSSFYTPTRYPGDYVEFTWQDAEQAFEAAERIKNFVLLKTKKK